MRNFLTRALSAALKVQKVSKRIFELRASLVHHYSEGGGINEGS